jgi:histidinol-phosphate/aromatic aminotransferase/cobyric acid decarboxylase-like protein
MVGAYPDPGAETLEASIADKIHCAPDAVLAGAGATELIHTVARTFLDGGLRARIPIHTFGEYGVAARAMGAKVVGLAMPRLRLDPEDAINGISRGDVLFLCNPNNPTGHSLSLAALRGIAEGCEDSGALLVVDEAFRDFMARPPTSNTLALDSEHCLLLRSFTKALAIPGVRVGYALGHPSTLRHLRKVRPPWTVDVFAEAAALAALREEAFLARSRSLVRRSREGLEASLRTVPSDANFLLLPTADASWTREVLLGRGLLVRDCTSFGLPYHIRVAVRRPRENRRLVDALRGEFPAMLLG